VSPNALGKGILFAECHLVHMAKVSSPSSAVVTAPFLCQVPEDTQQILCRVPNNKYLAKKQLLMYSSPSSICHTRQSLRRIFFRLYRVLQTLGKEPISGSVRWHSRSARKRRKDGARSHCSFVACTRTTAEICIGRSIEGLAD
jgi:hypothetical protein